MAYSAEINRENPTIIFVMRDVSGSTADKMKTMPDRSIAEHSAYVLNNVIFNIISECSKGSYGEPIFHYFDMGVLNYGGTESSAQEARICSGLPHTDEFILPIDTIAEKPLGVESRVELRTDDSGRQMNEETEVDIWFEPVSCGGTPMCLAFHKTFELLDEWCKAHPNSYPPTVLHLTDGKSTDGDPSDFAKELMNIGTKDGKTLLYNAHITALSKPSVQFPSSEGEVPHDEFARMLFNISSPFPQTAIDHANELGLYSGLKLGQRGFLFNADAFLLTTFFDIGTKLVLAQVE